MADQNRPIQGRNFDAPLILPAGGNVEPQRYIAEEPFDMTKYEFEVLRRPRSTNLLVRSLFGATIGVAIMLAGKYVAAILEAKSPTWQVWEWGALGVGIVVTGAVALIVRVRRSRAEQEREELEKVIDGHFATKKQRRVHIAGAEQ